MPSNPRSRGSSGGSHGSQRPPPIAPMSERQQMALVMQMTSQSFPPVTPTPAEERKRTRQQRNERGETPLHVAAIKGDHEQVQKLLGQGLEPDVPDFAGWTALHEACSYGWDQVVEVLVNGGANVNAKGLDEDTPLHDAATSGNLKMVKFLIDKGANPFVKNTKGKMPADYAAPHIYSFFMSLKESNTKTSNIGRPRDEGGKKSGNASGTSGEGSKRSSMDGLAQGEPDSKETQSQEKTSDKKDDGHNQVSSNVVSSSQDDVTSNRRPYYEEGPDFDHGEDDVSKRKKRKEEDKEVTGKHARTNNNRLITGLKPPGPASKTGVAPLGKCNTNSVAFKCSVGSSTSGKGSQSTQKGSGTSGKSSTQSSHSGKSSSSSKGSLNPQTGKLERKSPVVSPKPHHSKDDDEDSKPLEQIAPKVPPLKIVIPGGAGGSSNRNDHEGECSQRGGGKGRGGSSTLPYVIPCTSTDTGHASDSSDGVDDKRSDGKVARKASRRGGTRVLRSHRTTDDKERSPLRCSERSGSQSSHVTHKSPSRSGLRDHDADHQTVSSSTGGRHDSGGTSELHPRKRKIKGSKDSHSRESKNSADTTHESVAHAHNINSNPYQMYIHIRKQVEHRQKALFPVKPKPPKDFNKYLMNRCTYTLQSNVNPEPQIELPLTLPPQMKEEFIAHEKERHQLRIQHLVEKEKLVLAVEQEILRVHGRAERAVANQALPFSVCTMLRDQEVYNVIAPEQEEKRNAQRSRCNGRQINSWLQEVDDKWEKIKEGMLRRQHTEVETLHAVQKMGWEWKLKELGLCDYKSSPKIDTTHVPQINVSNFDLPA